MKKDFALDLRVARRASGLTQADCAHLLKIDASRISRLETGKYHPTAQELCTLAIIYGEPLNGLAGTFTEKMLHSLRDRLASMPDCPTNWRDTQKRRQTIEALAQRLAVLKPSSYDGA